MLQILVFGDYWGENDVIQSLDSTFLKQNVDLYILRSPISSNLFEICNPLQSKSPKEDF